MRSAILLLLLPAAILAQQASLEGIALDKVTGQPLPGVHIMLITGVMNGVTGSYGAMSDREGHFSIATVRPGTYLLLCDRSGYLHVVLKDAGIPNLSLKPGQQLKDYKIEMTPRAILSGRVVDENGDPVQGATVEYVAIPPESTAFLSASTDRDTDDRGEFRLGVAPGKYYLRTMPRGGLGNSSVDQQPERRNDGTIPPPYAPTFYPSTAVKGRATVVEAIPGRETSGLEIRLTRQQGLTITGIVSGIPEGGGRAIVQLRQLRDGSSRLSNPRGDSAALDGRFSFANLEPATYRIWATYRTGKTQLNSRVIEVKLAAADPAPVTLLLQPGVEISGSVVIDGDPPGGAAQKYTVRLDAVDDMSRGPDTGETDGEHHFQITGAGPGKYRVHVDGLPENAYVKSLELDGTPVASDVFEIPDGSRANTVKVIVSRAGAQISGRVLDSEGNRLLTPLAMVGLMRGPNSSDVDTTEVTPDSRYSFKAVRPGKYRLISLNPFDMNIDDESIWFTKLFQRGEEIEIKEGDRLIKDVKLLPKEDANAKK